MNNNYKKKFNNSEFLSEKVKRKKELVKDLEEKAKAKEKEVSKEFKKLSQLEIEAIFIHYIPIQVVDF